MNINKDEHEIVGNWIIKNGKTSEDDVCFRIRQLINKDLQLIDVYKDGWEKLYRNPEDGKYWELTYRHGEMQGGGPPSLHEITFEAARDKYNLNK